MAPTVVFLHLLALLPYFVLGKSVPPKIDVSYKAMGELVQTFPESGTFQVRFEEHYDADTKNAEFNIWELGRKMTFLEIAKANQTYLYDYDSSTCSVITKEQFLQLEAPPSFLGYLDTSGRIRFSIRNLLDLDPKYIEESEVSQTLRGIPAVYWMYKIQGTGDHKNTAIDVYSYWSDKTWNTTSGTDQVPLGFQLLNRTIVPGSKPITSSQFVNIFAFLKGVMDKKAFEPREGIYCENRTHPYKLPNFPLVDSLSLRSEFLIISSQDIRGMSAWYNTDDGLLRVDISSSDPYTADVPSHVALYTSRISSKELGVTFNLYVSRDSRRCVVTPLDKYQLQIEEVINPKLDKWSIHAIISRNTTNYTFIGNTHKRNIPCKLYQGIRKDWPNADSKIVSLWEWCFAFMIESEDESAYFRDNEIGVIYLSITILEDGNKKYPANYRLVHHIYDAVKENAGNLSFTTYDVDRCFSVQQKRFLEFTVSVTINDDNIHIYENATSDLNFLIRWKNATAAAAGVSLKTLRVAKVQSFIINKKLLVSLVLLDVHPDLPSAVKKDEPPLDKAIQALEKVINTGKLSISYTPSSRSKPIVLTATKGSLVKSFNKTAYEKITTTSTTPATTTRGTFPTISIVIDDTTTSTKTRTGSVGSSGGTPSGTSPGTPPSTPTGFSKSSSPTDSGVSPTPSGKPTDDKEDIVYEGHQKGTVAGVSVTMLLLGLIGGAGGTYYSYRGLPRFLRGR